MLIKTIRLENFMGYDNAEFNLKPTTFIFGRMRVGKTSILNAIEFALTGKARGLKQKNKSLQLAGKPGTFRVELDTDGSTIKRTTSGRPAKLPWSDEVIETCCRPMSIVHASPEQRQKLLLGSAQVSAATIGELIRGVRPMKTPDKIAAMPASLIDKAEQAAVDIRRAKKAALAEAKTHASEEPEDELVETKFGKMYLSDAASQDIEGQLEALRTKRRQLADTTDRDAAARELDEIRQSMTDTEASHTEEQRKQLQSEKAKASDALRDLIEQRDTLRRALAVARNQKQNIESVRSLDRCPTCGSECDSRLMAGLIQTLDKQIARDDAAESKLTDRIDAAERERDEAADRLAEWSNERARTEDRRAEWARRIDELERIVSAPEPDQAKIAELDKRIEHGETMLAAKQRYTASVSAYREGQSRIATLTNEIAEIDAVVGALKAGGPVRSRMSETTAIHPDPDFCAAFGIDVRLNEDGDLTLAGRMIELCSTSERWLAGAALAVGVARATGFNFVALDGAELLDSPGRVALSRWLQAREPTQPQVIITLTQPDQLPAPKDAGSFGAIRIQ